MRSHPGNDARAARALPCLAALIALSVFGVSRAGAVDPPAKDSTAKSAPAQGAPAQGAPAQGAPAQGAPAQGAPAPSAPAKPAEPSAKPAARPPVSAAAVKQATESPSPQKAEPAPKKTAAAPEKAAAAPKKTDAAPDSGMTLRGGQERTDFRTLTVEGEDRVHIDVERPPLMLDLDPEKVAGLESGTAGDVLNRVPPDLTTAYLAISVDNPSPYLAHPWLQQFATGPVARFRPNVKGVERWKLMVADSKGQTVTTFQGKGDPPKEITWDGRSQSGAPVTPGLTYSYIFEAYDKAGNKRNFVGEGFRVTAYRLDSPDGPMLVFSGQTLLASMKSTRAFGMGADAGSKVIPPVILEAAGWINASPRLTQPVRVTATARSFEQANLLAGRVVSALAEVALGDPARIQSVAEVVPDAPDGGTIRIGAASGSPPDAPPPGSPPLKSRETRSKSKAR